MRAFFTFMISLTLLHFDSKGQPYTDSKDELRVFLNCNTNCDMSFIKTEITFVDFVLDQFSSNIYVLITSQPTGSGGEEIKLQFEGKGNFNGMNDSLQFNKTSVETEDEYRNKLIKFLKLGLTRYASKSSFAEQLEISATINKNGDAINSLNNKKDKWGFWVYNVGANGNLNSNDNSRSYRITGKFNANKVTEKFKATINTYVSESELKIKYDGETSRFPNNSRGINTTLVGAINNHWSIGGAAAYEKSSFDNYRNRFTLGPAIEYSFFDYKDAVKKSVTLYYQAGTSYNDYIDSGYYDAPAHILFNQALSLNIGFIQKWGNLNFSTSWNNFLNNFNLNGSSISGFKVNTISLSGYMEIRIIKGLSFSIFSFANLTNGIYPNIPRKNFTRDDLLTSTRVVPTEKNIYLNFGVNYRFGSIYNNVVNPRFNGSGL